MISGGWQRRIVRLKKGFNQEVAFSKTMFINPAEQTSGHNKSNPCTQGPHDYSTRIIHAIIRVIMIQQISSLEDPNYVSMNVFLAASSQHVYEKQVKLLAPNYFLMKKANKQNKKKAEAFKIFFFKNWKIISLSRACMINDLCDISLHICVPITCIS